MSAELPPPVGVFLREVLTKLGWSHRDLAWVIEASTQSVSHRFAGRLRFDAKQANEYGAALGIEPALILRMQYERELAERRPATEARRRALEMTRRHAARAQQQLSACEEFERRVAS